MVAAVFADALWADELMQSSVSYSEYLINIIWLRFLMFFFSYIVFFSIFACKSSLVRRP